jgi:hypothetical protein
VRPDLALRDGRGAATASVSDLPVPEGPALKVEEVRGDEHEALVWARVARPDGTQSRRVYTLKNWFGAVIELMLPWGSAICRDPGFWMLVDERDA